MQPASVLDLSSLPLPKEHPKATELADVIQQQYVDIKKKIEASSAMYKAQAYKKKRQVIFKEGDLVWVILTKERNPAGPYTKLQQKKIGLCPILHKINDNAYQVKLPDHLRISNSSMYITCCPIMNQINLQQATLEDKCVLKRDNLDAVHF